MLEKTLRQLEDMNRKLGHGGSDQAGPQKSGRFVPGGPQPMAQEREEDGILDNISQGVAKAVLGRVAPWTLAVDSFLNRRR